MKEAGTALRNAEYAAAHPEKYTPQELIHLADKAEQTHIKSVELSLAARNSTYASRVMPVPVQKPIEPVVDAAAAAELRLNRRVSALEEKFLRKAAHFEYKAQRHPKSATMYRGLAEEQRRMAAVCADQEVARTMSLCDIVAASKAPAQPVAVPEPEVIPSIESDLAPKLLTEVAVYQQMSTAEKENAVTESSKKATSEEARWLDMSDRLTENIKGCITNQTIIPTITTALVEIERCQMMASIARANALSLEPTQEITEEAKWLEMATRLTAKAKEYAGQKLEASLLAEAERYEGMVEAAQTARWLEEPVALTAEEASNLADNDKFPVRIDDQDWHHIFVDPGHFPGGPPDDDMKEKIKKAIIALIEKYNDGSGKKFIAEKLYEIIENLEGLGPDIWKIKGIVVNGFIRLSTAYIKK